MSELKLADKQEQMERQMKSKQLLPRAIPMMFLILGSEEGVVPLGEKLYVTKSDVTIQELMGGTKPNDDPYFVIIQDGGVGDAICASAMIASAKKFYPNKKIIVGSSSCRSIGEQSEY